MRTLFLLNPTAGKADCTRTLPQQINVAAARAGLAPEEYTIQVTNHAGHARELANAAAQQARQSGEELRVFTAGGDGTFNEMVSGLMQLPECPEVGYLPNGSTNDFVFRPPSALPVWMRRLPTASRSSGASRCAAARWPMCFPLWNSCADTLAAGWSTPSMVKRWMWTA